MRNVHRAVVVAAVVGLAQLGCRIGFDESSGVARSCEIPSDLGSTGPLTSVSARRYAETIQQGMVSRLSGRLADDPNITIKLELWDGYGVFAGGAAHVGTFELDGPEASAATCGVCAYVSYRRPSGDVSGVDASEPRTQTLLGIHGTVHVTEMGGAGATLSADLAAVDFVEIDTATSERVPDGCTTSIDASALSGTLSPSSEGVGGSGGHGGDGDRGDDDDD